MSGKGFEIWGFSASILGTLFLVPLIYAWSKGPLPSTKIRQMEVILSETEALLRSALQEGTIAYDHYDREFKSWLWQYVFPFTAANLFSRGWWLSGRSFRQMNFAQVSTTSKPSHKNCVIGPEASRTKSLQS